ncbi:Subtilase family protein [Frankineae bacterium MT45]|nr:Subtilase family protein [Frankineae bacterium MT45]
MRRIRLTRSSLAAGLCAIVLTSAPGVASADTWRAGQWWLAKLNLTQAWTLSKGEGVKVALYDSGVDATHPDLKNAIAGGTDTTGQGTPDGLTPVASSIGPSTDPTNPSSKAQHGTTMAVFIAGRGHGAGNADGLLGSAPGSSILSISSTGADGSPAQATQAIHWAVAHGAKVINMSFTGGGPSADDIAYAESHDVVLVAGSGNDGSGGLTGPAGYFGVVTVGGVDANLNYDPNATYGGPGDVAGEATSGGIAVAGPDSVKSEPENNGIGLPAATTVAQGTYTTTPGTSNATAIVSGIIALIRAKFPTMDAANVINRLIKTATPASGGGYSEKVGFGVPDAYKALTADVPSVCENPLGSEATHSVGIWQSIIDNSAYTPGCTPTSSSAPASPGAVHTGSAAAASESSSSSALLIGIGAVVVVVVAITGVAFTRRNRRNGPGGPPAGGAGGGPGGPGGAGGGPGGAEGGQGGPGGPPPYPPQQYPGQPYPPQNYPPQNYPPQSYPPQNYPPQNYPPQNYPPQSYPPPPPPAAAPPR